MSNARACPDGTHLSDSPPPCSSCQGPSPRLVTAALCCCLAAASSCTSNTSELTAQIRRGSPLVSAGRRLSSHRVAGSSLRLSPSRALGLLEVVLLHAVLPCAPLDVGPRHASCTPAVPFPGVDLPWAAGGIRLAASRVTTWLARPGRAGLWRLVWGAAVLALPRPVLTTALTVCRTDGACRARAGPRPLLAGGFPDWVSWTRVPAPLLPLLPGLGAGLAFLPRLLLSSARVPSACALRDGSLQ